jgi:hypothetical protein
MNVSVARIRGVQQPTANLTMIDDRSPDDFSLGDIEVYGFVRQDPVGLIEKTFVRRLEVGGERCGHASFLATTSPERQRWAVRCWSARCCWSCERPEVAALWSRW